MMDHLRREPVTVGVKHPKTGQPAEVRLAWNVVADGVRWTLYSPGNSARLPLMIHQAAGGDFAPLAQASVNARYGAIQGITMGVFFSVTCAEDIPFIDAAEVPARTANTFLGDATGSSSRGRRPAAPGRAPGSRRRTATPSAPPPRCWCSTASATR